MTMLTRYDPFRGMVSLRDVMDRLVQDAMVSPGTFAVAGSAPMDVREDDDAYDVTLSLPGWKADEINVSLQQDTVTISGQRKPEEEGGKEGETYHMRERRFAAFSRSFSFPTPVDPDKVDAKFDNGELRLRLPKAESARPRQIRIGSGTGASDEGRSHGGGGERTGGHAEHQAISSGHAEHKAGSSSHSEHQGSSRSSSSH